MCVHQGGEGVMVSTMMWCSSRGRCNLIDMCMCECVVLCVCVWGGGGMNVWGCFLGLYLFLEYMPNPNPVILNLFL